MFFSEAQMRRLGAVTALFLPCRRCAPVDVLIPRPNVLGIFETSGTADPQTQHHHSTSLKAGMFNVTGQAETRAGDAKANNSVTSSFAHALFLHHLKSVFV